LDPISSRVVTTKVLNVISRDAWAAEPRVEP
jgi:hypothetical protein